MSTYLKLSKYQRTAKIQDLPAALKLQCVQELPGVLVKLADFRFLPPRKPNSVPLGWGLKHCTVNQHPKAILREMFCRSQFEKY